MKKIIDRTEILINHIKILDTVLRTNPEYLTASNDFDNFITDSFLDSIYPKINEEKNGRQMCLADIIEYILFGRAYWDIARRRTENTKLQSLIEYSKILVKITNLLYLQDSILTQSNNFPLRQNLISNLKNQINDTSTSYSTLNTYNDFLHEPWGNSRTATNNQTRKSAYKQLDQLMPKVRGLPNEIIAYIHLLRKNCGIILPIFLNQRFFSFDTSLDKGRVDFIAPPDLFILRENKNIIGIEVGRGSDRQVNKFSSRTGIPVIFADTENISNHRCPYCMKWTLFCDFVTNHIMDSKFRDTDKIYCKNCDIQNKNKGRTCPHSLVKENISDYYDGNAHFHYKCIEKYLINQGQTPQQIKAQIPEDDIFTYFPHVDGLDEQSNLYFQMP